MLGLGANLLFYISLSSGSNYCTNKGDEFLQVYPPGPNCYDCAWLSVTALSTVTRNLWL
jgi:hypothetical protein